MGRTASRGLWPLVLSGLLTLIAAQVAAGQQAPASQPLVRDLEVRGEGLVPEETILAAVRDTRVGAPLAVEAVQEDLRRIYELGYFREVTVDGEDLGDGLRVIFRVVEYPVVQEVRVSSDSVPAAKVREWLEIPQGEVFNHNRLEERVAQLQERALEEDDVWVRLAGLEIDPEGVVQVDVKAARVAEIRLRGNEKTQDEVILRELTFEPGDVLRRSELDRSLQRVWQLAFFDDVRLEFSDTGDPDRVALTLDVVERRTGTASFGAGYSTLDGFIGYVEVADQNFLGRGQRANLRWEFGGQRNSYELGFYEPYLRGLPTSFGFNLYNRRVERKEVPQPYSDHRVGGDLSFGRPVGEYTQGFIRFKVEDARVEPLEGSDYEGSEGSTRSLTLGAVTDTTDRPFFPKTGMRNRLSLELAPQALGGDADFARLELQHSRYRPAGSGGQAWAGRVMWGYMMGPDEGIPPHEELLVGGPDTVRGYDHGAFRGTRSLVVNGEYRFPIADVVQGVVFVDAGQAWDHREEAVDLSRLKVGYGVGIRINTPLGIIMRIDYGIGEDGGKTYFSLGPAF